jgi:hypothetical protein
VIQYSREVFSKSKSRSVLDTPLAAFAEASAAHYRNPGEALA